MRVPLYRVINTRTGKCVGEYATERFATNRHNQLGHAGVATHLVTVMYNTDEPYTREEI